MPVTRRYTPEHAPGDSYVYGISFEDVLPGSIGITSASILIFTNSAAPIAATDLTAGAVGVQGRIVYATITGGTAGTDYRLQWTVEGTDITQHTRSALLLCANTS